MKNFLEESNKTAKRAFFTIPVGGFFPSLKNFKNNIQQDVEKNENISKADIKLEIAQGYGLLL